MCDFGARNRHSVKRDEKNLMRHIKQPTNEILNIVYILKCVVDHSSSLEHICGKTMTCPIKQTA